jgi:hypothetical protein
LKRIHLLIDDETYKALSRHAKVERSSMSAVAREFIRQGLEAPALDPLLAMSGVDSFEPVEATAFIWP